MSNGQEIVERAVLLKRQGHVEEAKRLLADWLGTHPDDSRAQIEYLWLVYRELDLDEWKRRLEAAGLQDSPDPVVQRELAAAFYLLGEDRLAARHYRAALDRDPSDWSSMDGLAALSTTGVVSLEEAGQLMVRALRIAPTEWRLAYNLASVYALQQKTPEAERMLELALSLAPDSEKGKIRDRIQSLTS